MFDRYVPEAEHPAREMFHVETYKLAFVQILGLNRKFDNGNVESKTTFDPLETI